MLLISSFLCGLLFGIGLIISQMVNPEKVKNFLDVTGNWDGSLMFVMGSALAVFGLGYQLLIKGNRLKQPILGNEFFIPKGRIINKSLLIGAASFGLGWGLTGICPGPAMTNILSFQPKLFAFIASMLIGMFVARLVVTTTGKSST